MNRTIDRAKLFFFAVFLIGSIAMFGYQAYYIWPKQNCDADGGWWDPRDHLCAQPMPIWRITGRLPAHVTEASPTPAAPAAPAAKP